MTKKSKKPKTEAQKAKRREKRKAARKRREGKHKEAMIKMTGHGDYRTTKAATYRNSRKGQLNGRGDFWGDVVDTGKNLVGSGIKAGVNWLSDKAAGWLGSLIGMGDYKSTNSVYMNSMWAAAKVPTMHSTNRRTFIVPHREFIGQIQSTNSAFQVQSFTINPGLPNTAPWLYNIANSFQRYRILGMIVEFVPDIFAYGGGDVNGKVVLDTRYDVTTPAPTSFIEMQNSEFAVSGRPVDAMMMAIECDPSRIPVNVLEVRSGGLPTGANAQMFDHCIIDIANGGQADTTNAIGDIYLSYEIEFELPIDTNASGGAVLSDHFQLTGIATANNLGTTATNVATATLGGTVTTATAKYTFPSYVDQGEYMIVFQCTGSSATESSPTITVTGCTKLQVWGSSAGADQTTAAWAPNAVACTMQAIMCVVNITAASATVAITGATFAGTTGGDLFVTAYNGNMITLNHNKRRWHRYFAEQDKQRALEEEKTLQMIRQAVLSTSDLGQQLLRENERLRAALVECKTVSDDEWERPHVAALADQRALREAAARGAAEHVWRTDPTQTASDLRVLQSPRRPSLARIDEQSPVIQQVAPKGAPRNG